jgi:ABC-type multidrug transport system fused ATPase/permease subunit
LLSTGGILRLRASCPTIAFFTEVPGGIAALYEFAFAALCIRHAISIITVLPFVHEIIATYMPLNAFSHTIDNLASEIQWTGEIVTARRTPRRIEARRHDQGACE